LIIWDDASSDDSWAIIQSYSDPRIKTIRNSTNRRGNYGLNKFISEKAKGGFIAIHHSDDVWETDKLEKQVAFLDNHPEIGAVFTNALAITDNSDIFEDRVHVYYDVFDQPNRSRYEWLRYFFFHQNALCHPSVLIRKTCYEDCGLYRTDFKQLGDFDMWVRLCMKYEIHVLPEKLTRFRIHSDGRNTSSGAKENRSRMFFEFYQILSHYRSIVSYKEMVQVFPEAKEYYRESGFDAEFVLGMIALKTKPFEITKYSGLMMLLEALNDPSRAAKIKDLYNFDFHDFFDISDANDIFSFKLSDRVHTLEHAVREKEQSIHLLKPFSIARGLFSLVIFLNEKQQPILPAGKMDHECGQDHFPREFPARKDAAVFR